MAAVLDRTLTRRGFLGGSLAVGTAVVVLGKPRPPQQPPAATGFRVGQSQVGGLDRVGGTL